MSPLPSWISVLTNSKEEALNMAFRGEQSSGGEDGLEDLTKAIIEDVLRMPGNEVCCDCGAAGVYRSRASLHICFYFLQTPPLHLRLESFVRGMATERREKSGKTQPDPPPPPQTDARTLH